MQWPCPSNKQLIIYATGAVRQNNRSVIYQTRQQRAGYRQAAETILQRFTKPGNIDKDEYIKEFIAAFVVGRRQQR